MPIKRTKIRHNIASLLAIVWLIQFAAIASAIDEKDSAGNKLKGSMALSHIKSNQSAKPQYSLLQARDSLFAITLLDDKSHLLAGNNGLLVQVDKHQEYKKITVNTTSDLFSVHATQSGNVLLGADNGELFITDDELKNWSAISLDKSEAIFNFIELPAGKIILSGSYGLLMSSEPPYRQWKDVELPWAEFLKEAWQEFGEADAHLYSGCHNERGDSLVVGEFGIVLKRDFNGQWKKIHGGSIQPAIYGCDISNNGEDIILVGQKGLVYQSSDGGISWLEANISKGIDLYKVQKAKDISIIIGDKKNLYVSSKSSAWLCIRFAKDRPLGWFVDMTVDDENMGIVGSNGTFKLARYSSLLDTVNQLQQSGEFVSCE
jgi:photosystem II stability/assembly factor-like uncharacterized protein